MKTTLLFLVPLALGIACNTPQSSPSQSPSNIPAASTTFMPVEGKTKSSEILSNFGKPSYEDHNPDGRFFYQYVKKDGTILIFLFGQDNVLIRIKGYKDNNPK